jgi:hypothetical protein
MRRGVHLRTGIIPVFPQQGLGGAVSLGSGGGCGAAAGGQPAVKGDERDEGGAAVEWGGEGRPMAQAAGLHAQVRACVPACFLVLRAGLL